MNITTQPGEIIIAFFVKCVNAKQKYRGMFETQKSGNKTSSGEIGLRQSGRCTANLQNHTTQTEMRLLIEKANSNEQQFDNHQFNIYNHMNVWRDSFLSFFVRL